MAESQNKPLLLDVQNLRIEVTAELGARRAVVDDVSFSLHEGEVLGLIGESGAGKSSIGRSLLLHTRNECQITGGQIIFRGHDLRGLDIEARRLFRGVNVAYVPENAAAAFNPAHTLYEQVCEVALQHGAMNATQARKDAARLFKELDLHSPDMLGSRYPHQATRDELQRAMVAMAMISKPDLLVLDEPTDDFDVTTQVTLLTSIRKLIRGLRTATLFITRDPAVAVQIADRIVVLQHGRIVEEGPTAQLLQQPTAEYTHRLVVDRAMTRSVPMPPGDGAGQPVLAVRDLVAGYRGAPKVIDGVSIDLMRGETLAVIGEAGSGKSTLARAIAGLLPSQSGELLLDGGNLPARSESRSKEQRRRIQMIHKMENVALNPRQRLLDVIGRPVAFFFNKSRRDVRVRVEDLLRQIDLPPESIMRRPGDLSDGERLRVCIARALAAEPDVIICDELTSALDPLAADETLRLLRRIQDQTGVAYLLVTHDVGSVRRIASKVAVILNGQLAAYGPAQRVLNPPYHPYTELLLSSVPEIRPDWLDELLRKRRKVMR